MTSVRLMLNKCRKLNDGSFPLVFQLIHCRQKRLISTGYRVREQEFDDQLKKVNNCFDSAFTKREAAFMNRKLAQLHKKINDCIKQISAQADSYTVVDLVECIMGNNSSGSACVTLLQYTRMQINQKQAFQKDGIAAAYQSTLTSLSKYIATIWPSRSDVNLSEVTPLFVNGYERYLYQRGVSGNTVSYYLRNFRTLYNRAISE